MEPPIFVTSITTTFRGGRQMLASQKAGIFRFQNKELTTCTCRASVIMADASRLERVVIDNGKGKSSFCLPIDVSHNHVLPHRNHSAKRGETPTRTAYFIEPETAGSGAKTPCKARTLAYPACLQFAGYSGRKTPISLSFSVH